MAVAATTKVGRGCSSTGPTAPAQAGEEVANDSELRAKVRDLLLAEDPVNINYGGGADAYAPDITAIVERLGKCRNAQDVCSVIFDAVDVLVPMPAMSGPGGTGEEGRKEHIM